MPEKEIHRVKAPSGSTMSDMGYLMFWVIAAHTSNKGKGQNVKTNTQGKKQQDRDSGKSDTATGKETKQQVQRYRQKDENDRAT